MPLQSPADLKTVTSGYLVFVIGTFTLVLVQKIFLVCVHFLCILALIKTLGLHSFYINVIVYCWN